MAASQPASSPSRAKDGGSKKSVQKINAKTQVESHEREDGSAIGQQVPVEGRKREQTEYEKNYYAGRSKCPACGVFDGLRANSSHCDSCGAKVG